MAYSTWKTSLWDGRFERRERFGPDGDIEAAEYRVANSLATLDDSGQPKLVRATSAAAVLLVQELGRWLLGCV